MIRDYLKAVQANKVTLVGYLTTIAGGLIKLVENPSSGPALSEPILGAGIFLLGVTELGLGTMEAYRNTRNRLNRKKPLQKPDFYCGITGYNLALREAGLESEIKYPTLSTVMNSLTFY